MYTGGGITDAVKKMDRGGRDKERSLSCARCIVRAHEQPEEHQIQDEPNQRSFVRSFVGGAPGVVHAKGVPTEVRVRPCRKLLPHVANGRAGEAARRAFAKQVLTVSSGAWAGKAWRCRTRGPGQVGCVLRGRGPVAAGGK